MFLWVALPLGQVAKGAERPVRASSLHGVDDGSAWLGGREVVPADWGRSPHARNSPAARGLLGYGYMWWVGQGPATLRGNDCMAAIGSNNAIAVFPPLDLVLVQLRESNDRNFRALVLFAMIQQRCLFRDG